MAEHTTLAQALSAFQAEVPKMSKDETAKVKSEKANYTYGYASLDQFVEAVEPVLGKHGLSITSSPDWTPEGRFVLTVTLLHESGEERSGRWPLPDPNRSGPQDIGSAMTYGRRYIGWSLTGTFPGGIDDDGAKAQALPRDSWDSARPAATPRDPEHVARGAYGTPAPPDVTPPAAAKVWTDQEIQAQHGKLVSLELEKAVKLYDWMGDRDLHNRPIGEHRDTGTNVLALRMVESAFVATIPELDVIKEFAEARGLMKIQVSETETLDQVLVEARILRTEEKMDESGNAAEMREKAATSWEK